MSEFKISNKSKSDLVLEMTKHLMELDDNEIYDVSCSFTRHDTSSKKENPLLNDKYTWTSGKYSTFRDDLLGGYLKPYKRDTYNNDYNHVFLDMYNYSDDDRYKKYPIVLGDPENGDNGSIYDVIYITGRSALLCSHNAIYVDVNDLPTYVKIPKSSEIMLWYAGREYMDDEQIDEQNIIKMESPVKASNYYVELHNYKGLLGNEINKYGTISIDMPLKDYIKSGFHTAFYYTIQDR